MKLAGSYTFDAPRDVVWQAFLDPEVLAKALPGTEKLEKVGENDYKGAMKVKIGPVQGTFQGTVALSDLHPPESYNMLVNGRGPAGFMKGEGNIKLEDQGQTTLLHYEGDAQVGGRLASVGQRLIDSTSKVLTRQALENLHAQIKANQVSDSAEEAEATSQTEAETEARPAYSAAEAEFEVPSQTQFAFDVARDVLEDMIPPEKRTTILAATLGVVALFVLVEWWTNHLANRVANILERRR